LQPSIEAVETLVVPSLSLLDVYHWVLRNHGETQALQATALMQRGRW
jgi:hypothetical protein